jgi:hypothetical protein
MSMQEKIRQAKHIIKNESCYGLKCSDCLIFTDGCHNISMPMIVKEAKDYLNSLSYNRFVGMTAEEGYQLGVSETRAELSKNQMTPMEHNYFLEISKFCDSLGMKCNHTKSRLQVILDFIKELSDKSKTCNTSEENKSSMKYDIIEYSRSLDMIEVINKKLSEGWELYGNLISREFNGMILQTIIKRNR